MECKLRDTIMWSQYYKIEYHENIRYDILVNKLKLCVNQVDTVDTLT